MGMVNTLDLLKIGIILAVLSFVSACGQKGDLYLPLETRHSIMNFSASG